MTLFQWIQTPQNTKKAKSKQPVTLKLHIQFHKFSSTVIASHEPEQARFCHIPI